MPKTGNLLGDVWIPEQDEVLLRAMYEVPELKGHHAVLIKRELAKQLGRSEKAVTLRWMRLIVRHRDRITIERTRHGLSCSELGSKHHENKSSAVARPALEQPKPGADEDLPTMQAAVITAALEQPAQVEPSPFNVASTSEFQQTIQFLHKAATTHEKLVQAISDLLAEVERQRANAVWAKARAEQAEKERDDLVNAFALATKIVTEGDETLSRIRKLNVDRMGVVG